MSGVAGVDRATNESDPLLPVPKRRHDARPHDEESVMKWAERIVVDPRILVGKPIIKGTRIAVQQIMDELAEGWTEKDILDQHDQLTVDDLHACYAYCAELVRDEIVVPRT